MQNAAGRGQDGRRRRMGATVMLGALLLLAAIFGPAAAAEPSLASRGVNTLGDGDLLDLDRGRMGVAETADIARERGAGGKAVLAPRPGALIGLRGDRNPSEAECRAARFSERAVLMHRLRPGRYFCVRTNEGRLAALRVLQSPERGRGALRLEHRTFR